MRLVYGTNAGTYFPQAKRRGGFLFLSSLLGSHTCSPPPPPEHRFSPSSMGHSTVYYSHPRKNCKGARKWYAREERFFVYADFCAILRLVVLGASWRAGQNHIAINTNKINKISAITRERRREEGEEGKERLGAGGSRYHDILIASISMSLRVAR